MTYGDYSLRKSIDRTPIFDLGWLHPGREISFSLDAPELEVKLPNSSAVSQIVPEPYVDAERAASYLSISRKTLLRFARKGKVPARGIGEGKKRMWRFRISELDHWMQSEVTSVSDQGLSSERKKFL